MKKILLERTVASIFLVLMTVFVFKFANTLLCGKQVSKEYKRVSIEEKRTDREIKKIIEEFHR